MRIYTQGEYSEIDWAPEAVDLEDAKERIFEVFSSQLTDLVKSRGHLFDLSEFYERHERSEYNNLLGQQLVEQMSHLGRTSLRYTIWGMGAHLLIQEKFPDCRLVAAFDTFEEGEFFGLGIRHPEQLGEGGFDFLFICTHAGRQDALKKVEALGLESRVDYMFLVSRVVNPNHSASEDFKRHLAQFIVN